MVDAPDAPPPESPEAPPPPRPRWHPAARVAVYLVAFVVLQGVVETPVLVWWLVTGHSLRTLPIQWLLVTEVPLAPLILWVSWLMLRHLDRKRLADIGVRLPARSTGGSIAIGVGLGVGLALVWAVMVTVPGYLSFHGLAPAFARSPVRGTLFLVGLALVFLVQSATEELAFRGYVFHTLLSKVSPSVAAIVSSLLFAAAHLGNPGYGVASFVNTFVIGMVLVSLVRRRGSLLGASLLHFAWNFTIACLLSVPVSGFDIFHLMQVTAPGPVGATGGGYGPEASWVLTVPVAVVALVLIPRKKPAE